MSQREESSVVSRTSSVALIGLGLLLLSALALWAGSADRPWLLFVPKYQWIYAYLPFPMLAGGLSSLTAGLVMWVAVSQRSVTAGAPRRH